MVTRHIDNWKFWMTMFGFGLAFCGLGVLYVLKAQFHEESLRAAASRASSAAQVATCFSGVKQAPLIEGFIDAHLAIVDNSIIATTAALKITTKTDPLYEIRVQSLARLKKAQRNALALQEASFANAPTQKKCVGLAKRLHVPYNQYLPKGPAP